MHKTTTFKPPLLTVSDSCHLDAVFISFSFLRFSLISKNIDMSPPANIIHFCVHPRPPPPPSQRSVIYLATIVFLSPKQKPAPENQPIGGRWFPPNRKISRQNSFPGVARGGGDTLLFTWFMMMMTSFFCWGRGRFFCRWLVTVELDFTWCQQIIRKLYIFP